MICKKIEARELLIYIKYIAELTPFLLILSYLPHYITLAVRLAR